MFENIHSHRDITIEGEWLQIFRPLLAVYGLWSVRDLYRATPAVTGASVFCVLSEEPSCLVTSFEKPGVEIYPQCLLLKFMKLHVYFVCLGFFVPHENFSLIWRRHHYRWRAANFDLCSALAKQWGFFSVPQILWHGASVYNGHLQLPVTLTPVAERLAVELSRPVFTILTLLPTATICLYVWYSCASYKSEAVTEWERAPLATWRYRVWNTKKPKSMRCRFVFFKHSPISEIIFFYIKISFLLISDVWYKNILNFSWYLTLEFFISNNWFSDIIK